MKAPRPTLCATLSAARVHGPPGPILRNPTTLPAGNEDSQAYSTSSGNCKTLPAGSTSPRKDHLALFRETSRPCLRVMKAPRGLENSRNPGAPGLPKVSSCHLGNKTCSGIPTVWEEILVPRGVDNNLFLVERRSRPKRVQEKKNTWRVFFL